MNDILKQTHKKSNIDLLKIRDKHFNVARRLNRVVTACAFLPVIVATISYIFMNIAWVDDYRDLYIGVLTFLMFVIVHFILKRIISHHLDISNAYREEYDCRVFNIKENRFAHKIDNPSYENEADKIITSREDMNKYEVWYHEMQVDSKNRNILISQLDNIIYTFYIYKSYKWLLTIVRIILIALFLAVSLIFASGDWKVIVLTLVASFTVLQLLIEDYSNTNEMIKRNKSLMEYLLDKDGEIRQSIDDETQGKELIRSIQDQIIDNRRQSIFVPSFIRKIYLTGKMKEKYFQELHKYRDIYYENNEVNLPSNAKDIEIVSKDEKSFTDLETIHERLLSIFNKVKDAFDKEGVMFMLDGGSLIGAVRPSYCNKSQDLNGGFIFWDDDIDISIPYEMINKAKEAIKKHCSDILDVQDYDNDEYYSPRLSNFRIRDKGSIVSEKDSELYPLYNYRGLFIDVYAYHPIYKSVSKDKSYRKRVIYPLYKKLFKLEQQFPAVVVLNNEDKKKKYLERFKALKAKYMKKVDYYLANAKNDEYYIYTPNYIDNINKPGPYLKKQWLYENEKHCKFEGLETLIPSSYEDVLKSYYGEKWFVPPFKTLAEWKKEFSNKWYHEKVSLGVSVLKHLSTFDIANK